MSAAQIITIVLSVIAIACAILGTIFAIMAQKLSRKTQLLNTKIKALSQQTTKTEEKNMGPFRGILVRLKKEPIEKFIDIEALEQYYVSHISKYDNYADVPMDLMEKLLLVAIYKKLCLENNSTINNADDND